jgi:hypothetical protein
MTLSQLKPGTAFHVEGFPNERASVKDHHGGGTVVILSRPKTREFVTVDGRTVLFHDPGKKTETWASACPVIPE